MVLVPYAVLPPSFLANHYRRVMGIAEKVEYAFPYLQLYLKQAKIPLTGIRYLSMCILSDSFLLVTLMVLLSGFFYRMQAAAWLLYGIALSLLIVLFIFMQQMYYPKLLINKRVRDIERNSLVALQSILIQLRSGVPLFDIMVNIAGSDYGEVSEEFLKVVKQINAGKNQIEALEEMTLENPSVIFRRAVWQMVNGLKTGSDMTYVISEIMHSISQEQLIQIEHYGGQLSPLSMFYMIIAVIFPSLGINFLIIGSAFFSLSEIGVKLIFWSVYAIVLLFQIMFLGFIKSRRPSLLTDE